MPTYFITAIDTDAGKTVVTGLLARHILRKGRDATTMKIVQTGCEGKVASDIEVHRDLMNKKLRSEDIDGLTNPYVFKHPASPHLSAALEGKTIKPEVILGNIAKLEQKYEYLFIEGAGGLMVPLQKDYILVDFIEEHKLKTILVSSSRLGSINHTLLTLDSMKSRGIECLGIVYNHFPSEDKLIVNSSAEIIEQQLKKYYPNAGFVQLPVLNNVCSIDFDFDKLL